jgi:hypothetical protein
MPDVYELVFTFSSYSQRLLMEKLKLGSMTIRDLEWIMMHLDIGAPLWHIVVMDKGAV